MTLCFLGLSHHTWMEVSRTFVEPAASIKFETGYFSEALLQKLLGNYTSVAEVCRNCGKRRETILTGNHTEEPSRG